MRSIANQSLAALLFLLLPPLTATPSLRAQRPAGSVSSASVGPLASAEFTVEHARHLLLRAGFGGTPEEIQRLHGLGLAAAVRQLVDYDAIPDAQPAHGVTPAVRPAPAALANLSAEERMRAVNQVRRGDQQQFQGLRAWWMTRMLRTPRPLEEKMTLFWHGHFTSGYRDVRSAFQMAVQNDLLRDHATRGFRELLGAISRDPAMLEYLDNNRNVRRAPNENYARELMELFTLGVGNYGETDIKEAARAFTGWTFRNATFSFVARSHDYDNKQFLGQTGNFDGDDVIRIILEQEAAPRFLARKLLTFFAVEPTDAEVEPYAALLRQVDFQIKPLLRALFSSRWFYSDRVVGKQIKSPVMLVVSTLRSMGVRDTDAMSLVRACDSIGQVLMEPPNVKGWDGGAAWISSSNLLTRYNITRSLVAGAPPAGGRGGDRGVPRMEPPRDGEDGAGESMQRAPTRAQRRGADNMVQRTTGAFSALDVVERAGARDPAAIVKLLEDRFLVSPLAPERRQALLDFLTGRDGSLPLDLKQRRAAATKLGNCLHLLTTTPEFQIC